MKPFQIILITVFMLLAVSGVIVFALGGTLDPKSVPSAVVWGTLNGNDFQQIVSTINAESQQGPLISANYEQHDPAKIDSDFLNALAEGKGPDIIIYSDEKLLKYKSKLFAIPYATLPERDFIDTYIDASSIFLTMDGVIGIPFAVDPMVMYWNKTIFSAAGLSQPPTKWSELPALSLKLIQKGPTGGINRALVAMGEYRNVNNAGDILATLFFQSGNPISVLNRENDRVTYILDQQNYSGNSDMTTVGDASMAVDFYAAFSNPASPVYSWNRSEANSDEAFSAGDLALYFGKASEIMAIRSKNPNLNFDVASMLQDENSAERVVKGNLYAMSIVKSSKDIASAYKVLQYLVNVDSQIFWSGALGVPPVRRDLLATDPGSPYQAVFYRSAIQSKTWLNPDMAESDKIFQEMIESVTTGKSRSNEVLTTLSARLQNLYDNR